MSATLTLSSGRGRSQQRYCLVPVAAAQEHAGGRGGLTQQSQSLLLAPLQAQPGEEGERF